MYESLSIIVARFFSESHCYFYERIYRFFFFETARQIHPAIPPQTARVKSP